jgi:chitinase
MGAGCARRSAVGRATGSPAGHRQFRVVGYLPSWRGNFESTRYADLTHINYAFAKATPAGQLEPLRNPDRLAAIVRGAHAHGVKVSIAVGGWNGGDDRALETLAADPTARTTFVSEVADFITRHQLDGIDMDWEYPDPGESARNNAALMRALRDRLSPAGKLLTAAVVGDGDAHGAGILPEVFEYTDFVNIMAYDDDHRGTRPHSTYDYAVRCVQYWRKRGLPREKLVLGVPFYGKQPGTSYRDLIARDPQAAQRDEVGGVHYNGIATIKKKTDLALAEGSGVMIWEITQDTSDQTSLLRAIREALNRTQRT